MKRQEIIIYLSWEAKCKVRTTSRMASETGMALKMLAKMAIQDTKLWNPSQPAPKKWARVKCPET